MKTLVATVLLIVLLLIGAWAMTGQFFSGQQFDTLPDGTILVYGGTTPEGMIYIERHESINSPPLSYVPITIPTTMGKGGTVVMVKSFTAIVCGNSYTFEPQPSGGIKITRIE